MGTVATPCHPRHPKTLCRSDESSVRMMHCKALPCGINMMIILTCQWHFSSRKIDKRGAKKKLASKCCRLKQMKRVEVASTHTIHSFCSQNWNFWPSHRFRFSITSHFNGFSGSVDFWSFWWRCLHWTARWRCTTGFSIGGRCSGTHP